MTPSRFARVVGRIALVLAPAALVVASAATESDKAAATKGMVKRSDLEIVDCLLPGQVRQLGNSSFLTQRRPIRTTTSECSIRGGEYVAYDRADLQSALRIWMQAAEGGDVDAQRALAGLRALRHPIGGVIVVPRRVRPADRVAGCVEAFSGRVLDEVRRG